MPDQAAERRQLVRVLVIAVAVAIVFAVSLVISQMPKKLTEADRATIRDYGQIRIALAQDDLTSTKQAATAMIRDDGGQPPFHDSAVVIAGTDSLAEARSAFARMSERAQRLVRGNAGFFIVGCPLAMDSCPVKSAIPKA